MKWYKRDPEAFKGGTLGLSLEEIGAYSLFLDDIHARNGQIPDDIRYLCRLWHCDPRVAQRLRYRLVWLGKIQLLGAMLVNERATRDICVWYVRIKLACSWPQKPSKNNENTLCNQNPESREGKEGPLTPTNGAEYGTYRQKGRRNNSVVAAAQRMLDEIQQSRDGDGIRSNIVQLLPGNRNC
jgi:Protein of unknown function (DUF1376)